MYVLENIIGDASEEDTKNFMRALVIRFRNHIRAFYKEHPEYDSENKTNLLHMYMIMDEFIPREFYPLGIPEFVKAYKAIGSDSANEIIEYLDGGTRECTIAKLRQEMLSKEQSLSA